MSQQHTYRTGARTQAQDDRRFGPTAPPPQGSLCGHYSRGSVFYAPSWIMTLTWIMHPLPPVSRNSCPADRNVRRLQHRSCEKPGNTASACHACARAQAMRQHDLKSPMISLEEGAERPGRQRQGLRGCNHSGFMNFGEGGRRHHGWHSGGKAWAATPRCASRSGRTLVACPVGIVKIMVPYAPIEIAAVRGNIPDLRTGSGRNGGGQQGIALCHERMGGRIDEGRCIGCRSDPCLSPSILVTCASGMQTASTRQLLDPLPVGQHATGPALAVIAPLL